MCPCGDGGCDRAPFRSIINGSSRPEDDIAKLGRNDRCHCGSGKKYKKCHLAADDEARTAELAAQNAALAEAAREAAEEDPEGAALKEEAAKEAFSKGDKHKGKPAQSAPTGRQMRRRGIS